MGVDRFAEGLAAQALSFVEGTIPIIACLGDSIMANNNNPSLTGTTAYGPVGQAQAWAYGRFEFPATYNFGIAGQTSAQILARVGTVIAAQPGACVLMLGTNDATVGGLTRQQTLTNSITACKALMGANIRVAFLKISPRSTWSPLTGAQITAAREGYYYVNRGMEEFAASAPNNMFALVDTDLNIMNWSSATGDPIATATQPATQDGLHPANWGGDTMGKALATVLERWFAPINQLILSQANIFDATNNPRGNRLGASGFMLGTGGTAGAGASGSVATNWALQRTIGSTLTAAGSLVTEDSDYGGQAQQIDLGGSGGAATEQMVLQRDISNGAGSWQVGDTVFFGAEITVSNLVDVQNVSVTLQDTINGDLRFGLLGHSAPANRIQPNWSKFISTMGVPLTVRAGATLLRCRIVIDCALDGAGPTGTIIVKNAALRTSRGF